MLDSGVVTDTELKRLESYKTEVETTNVHAEPSDVKEALRIDVEFFIDFFLHEELEYQIPPIHKRVFTSMTDLRIPKMMLAIPRGFAKTTLAKLAVVWYLLFSPYRFVVYITNTSPKAKAACNDVLGFIISKNFQQVFGQVQFEKKSETEGWWVFNIGSKKCILRAMSTGQSLRGINIDNRRPEVAICDDLENKDNTNSEALQQGVIEWFFAEFIKALAKDYKIVVIGNMLGAKCLLNQFSKLKTWQTTIYGCLLRTAEGFKSLWPDRWPVAEIIADYREYQLLGLTHIWMAEMMNMPGAGAHGFKANQFHYINPPNPDDLLCAFQTVDPAFSKKTSADDTAVVIHGIQEDKPPMVVDFHAGRMTEGQMFDKILENAFHWNAWVVGVESTAAQSVLIAYFELLKIEHQVPELQLVPLVSGITRKTDRISAWVGLMEHSAWGIPEGDIAITNQLLLFDKTKSNNTDDIIDACAYGPQMIERYYGLIRHSFTNVLEHQPQGESELCDA